MKKYDIFISHKSQDKDQLTLLEEYLDNEGYSYWSDSKMKEGESWTNQIDRAISESRIMIVLLSQYVIDDPDNMEAEIVSATQNRLKFIVVKLDDSLINDYKGVFNLYLKKVQWINAKNDITNAFKTINVSIQMNLSVKEDRKEELNEELKIELARLAKKQKEDYERDIQNRVLESLFDISILKIKNLISERLYSQALTEIESLLRTNNSWKVHEQKLICLTKNYTCFDQSVYKELEVIETIAPPEEFLRINNTIKEKKADIKKALQQEQRDLEAKALERKREKKAFFDKEIDEKKCLIDEINEQLSLKKISKFIKFSICLLIIIFLSFFLFTGDTFVLFICMATIFLIYCFINNGFFRFLFAVCTIGFAAMYGEKGLTNINPNMKLFMISSDIADSIKPIIEAFVNVEKVSLSCAVLFFFMTLSLSVIGIISYSRFRKDSKTKHFFSKIKSFIFYFIFSIILSIAFLVLYSTTKNVDNGINISFAVITGVFMIFSVPNFKKAKELNDLTFYKTEKNKVEKEIEQLKREAEDIA